MKKINFIVLDKSIFDLNNKNLTLFEDSIKIDYVAFEDWFYKKYLKDKNIVYCKDFIREYIHPSHIKEYTKLFLDTVKKEVEKDVYIITINPDILQYFSSLGKKDKEIEIKYYVAYKDKKKYILKDFSDEIDEVYKALVDETNEYFFQEMKNDVFGEKK